jgi:hypothetical protein
MNAKDLKIPERNVSRACIQALRWAGWYCIRHQQSMGSHDGLSDYQILKNGRCIFIEFKNSEGGKKSTAQKVFKHDVEKQGFEHRFVKSVDEIKDLLK